MADFHLFHSNFPCLANPVPNGPCSMDFYPNGRGVARLFKMRGRQGGLRGERGGGLTGTQNGGSPQNSVQSVISFGGKKGEEFLPGGSHPPAPIPLWLHHCQMDPIVLACVFYSLNKSFLDGTVFAVAFFGL